MAALWTSVVALLAAVAQFILFTMAFDALNRAQPDRAAATAWAQASVALGAIAVALTGFAMYRRRVHAVWPVASAGLGLATGTFLAYQLPETFGLLGELGWLYLEGGLLALLVAPFVVFLVFVFTDRGAAGWGIGLGTLGLHATAYLVVVGYLLANLERLAGQAEEANASSLALIATLLALAGAAWARRRDV